MSPAHRHGSRECQRIFERLSEYLDGELDPRLCAGFDEHLADCPPCLRFLESLRRTVSLLERTEAPALPARVRREVLEAYRRLRTAD